MTRPITIPPPGAPLRGLSPLLTKIATAAARDDMPASGIAGREGTSTAPPPQCSLALFQLTGDFAAGPPSPTWPAAPGNNWFCAPATRVEYYPDDDQQDWNTPDGADDGETTPDTITVWAPTGYQLGDEDSDRALPTALQDDSGSGPYFYPPAGNGEWILCLYDEPSGCWIATQPFEDILGIELKADLTPGGSAEAYLMLPDGSDANTDLATITVYDTPEACRRALGSDTMSGTSSGSGSGQGARGKAKYNHSTRRWEFVSLQVQAKLCSAQTNAVVYPGDSTFEVNTVVPLDDGQSPVAGSSQTLTVSNLPDWGGPSGTPCEIVPDGRGGWRLATAERMSRLYYATPNAAVSGGFTATSLTPAEIGLSPFQSSDSVTVNNLAGWTTTEAGVTCIISLLSKTTAEFIQGPCGR